MMVGLVHRRFLRFVRSPNVGFYHTLWFVWVNLAVFQPKSVY
jgi:hypothetical protein